MKMTTTGPNRTETDPSSDFRRSVGAPDEQVHELLRPQDLLPLSLPALPLHLPHAAGPGAHRLGLLGDLALRLFRAVAARRFRRRRLRLGVLERNEEGVLPPALPSSVAHARRPADDALSASSRLLVQKSGGVWHATLLLFWQASLVVVSGHEGYQLVFLIESPAQLSQPKNVGCGPAGGS
jgi:hypothetical protein